MEKVIEGEKGDSFALPMSAVFEESTWKGKADDLKAFAATQRGPE